MLFPVSKAENIVCTVYFIIYFIFSEHIMDFNKPPKKKILQWILLCISLEKFSSTDKH